MCKYLVAGITNLRNFTEIWRQSAFIPLPDYTTMLKHRSNKLKIINDPVYGFINIPDESIFDLIESSQFQRLRNIKQLGLTHLVFPGAIHTRFQHALGAMHLMGQAIHVLRQKGNDISPNEALALRQAILLHDIGHGPFSHALEGLLLEGINHEQLTGLFMKNMNRMATFNLETAFNIFSNTHPNKALHQLVSGQLDMDRLDYLNRDSFFTGVSEGVVGWDRIIEMLNISEQQLVIEEKGIYSIEKFLVARRLMFWQVYLHKTVLAAENMLKSIIRRAKYLMVNGTTLPATPSLERFLKNHYTLKNFEVDSTLLEDFAMIDDYDIYTAIKIWSQSAESVLRTLCSNFIKRNLYRIEVQKLPFEREYVEQIRKKTGNYYKIGHAEIDYFVIEGTTVNNAYDPDCPSIMVLGRDGSLTDITQASDQLNLKALANPVEKHFLCYSKDL